MGYCNLKTNQNIEDGICRRKLYFGRKMNAYTIGKSFKCALTGTSCLFVRRREMSHCDADENAAPAARKMRTLNMKSGHKRLNGAGHLRQRAQWACSGEYIYALLNFVLETDVAVNGNAEFAPSVRRAHKKIHVPSL